MKLISSAVFLCFIALSAFAQTTGPAISLAPTTTAIRDPGTNNWRLITQEKAPGAPTVALAGAGAGSVTNGDHRCRVELISSVGHTNGGTISGIVTVTNNAVNGKIAISGIPTGSVFITSRKVYCTVASGSTYYLLSNGTIADNTTTTLTANDSDATLGAAAVMPTNNSTANPVLTYTGATGAVSIAGAAAGTVVGPASAVNGHLAIFSGPTGKIIADGGAIPTATPAGSDTQVQFNDSGVFGGDAGLTYNKTTDVLTTGAENISGVDGAGYLQLRQQSAANPSASILGPRLFANSSYFFGWKNSSNSSGVAVNFDDSNLTANRAYKLPNSDGTFTLDAGGAANVLLKRTGVGIVGDSQVNDNGTILTLIHGNDKSLQVANADDVTVFYVDTSSNPSMRIGSADIGNGTLWTLSDADKIVQAFVGSESLTLDGTAHTASIVAATNFALGTPQVNINGTVTTGGTVGAQTINKSAGSVNFGVAATSLVVTNSTVTASSIIIATVGTQDTTMKSVQVVAGSGTFTLFSNAAATAETRVNFWVITPQ